MRVKLGLMPIDRGSGVMREMVRTRMRWLKFLKGQDSNCCPSINITLNVCKIIVEMAEVS